jgi:ethanolamine ammonia-lyase large subunit
MLQLFIDLRIKLNTPYLKCVLTRANALVRALRRGAAVKLAKECHALAMTTVYLKQ